MKLNRRIPAVLLALVLLLSVLPAQALAAGGIVTDAPVTLTIDFHDGDTPIKGGEFSLYKVAEVAETGELTVVDAFSAYAYLTEIRGKTDETDQQWRELAATLEGVVRDKTSGIAADYTGKTDETGRLTFGAGEIAQGLYLVVGSRVSQSGYYYDPMAFWVQLPARDAENGQTVWDYEVTVTVKFDRTNIPVPPGTTSRKVLKLWDDEGHETERPAAVTVRLIRDDGMVYSTVTLTAENNWRHTWNGLDAARQWYVVEDPVEGYDATVTREGITFVVTNSRADAPEEPDQPTNPTPPTDTDEPTTPATPTGPILPQTGQLWWPVPALIAAGLLLVVLGLLRRRSE